MVCLFFSFLTFQLNTNRDVNTNSPDVSIYLGSHIIYMISSDCVLRKWFSELPPLTHNVSHVCGRKKQMMERRRDNQRSSMTGFFFLLFIVAWSLVLFRLGISPKVCVCDRLENGVSVVTHSASVLTRVSCLHTHTVHCLPNVSLTLEHKRINS